MANPLLGAHGAAKIRLLHGDIVGSRGQLRSRLHHISAESGGRDDRRALARGRRANDRSEVGADRRGADRCRTKAHIGRNANNRASHDVALNHRRADDGHGSLDIDSLSHHRLVARRHRRTSHRSLLHHPLLVLLHHHILLHESLLLHAEIGLELHARIHEWASPLSGNRLGGVHQEDQNYHAGHDSHHLGPPPTLEHDG